MNYGRAIKIVRAARELNQAQLAEGLSIGTSHLSLIEAGKRKPSVAVLEEIAQVLDVPYHLLMLLASEPADLARSEDADHVEELAKSLLRVLLAGDK